MSNYIDKLSVNKESFKEKLNVRTQTLTPNKSELQSFNSVLQESIKIIGKSNPELNLRVDGAVGKLARFFGIGKNLMLAILQSLNISPEDLIDDSKKELIICELSKHFQLDNKKEKELEELFKKI